MHSIDCPSHGKTKWNGECCCSVCGRTWRIYDLLPSTAPMCTCGVRLVLNQDQDDDGTVDYSAVAICPRCYERHRPQVPAHLLMQPGHDLKPPPDEHVAIPLPEHLRRRKEDV